MGLGNVIEDLVATTEEEGSDTSDTEDGKATVAEDFTDINEVRSLVWAMDHALSALP